jgi:hypothetical protein
VPRRQICFNDYQVCVGAFTKGRSSSRKLNRILRYTGLMLVAMGLVLSLVWIGTDRNPADYPSRFKALPSPKLLPEWAAPLFGGPSGPAAAVPPVRAPGCGGNIRLPRRLRPGLECFSVPRAGLTTSCRAAGLPMLDPFDGRPGRDVFDRRLDGMVRRRELGWLWLSPPCSSFS